MINSCSIFMFGLVLTEDHIKNDAPIPLIFQLSEQRLLCIFYSLKTSWMKVCFHPVHKVSWLNRLIKISDGAKIGLALRAG